MQPKYLSIYFYILFLPVVIMSVLFTLFKTFAGIEIFALDGAMAFIVSFFVSFALAQGYIFFRAKRIIQYFHHSSELYDSALARKMMHRFWVWPLKKINMEDY